MAIWRAATGWQWREGDHDEFAGKLYPPTGSSVQLLFQRLGSMTREPPYEPISTSAMTMSRSETARLAELGAERFGPGRDWIVLRDPVGTVTSV